MPKFTTPYDTLLRVRRIEEDRAKAALAAANLAHRQAEATVEQRRADVAAISSPDGEIDLGAFRRHAAHTVSAAKAVVWSAAIAEKTGDARLAAVEDTRRASMRTQGLERLVDRAKEARVAEMLAADQRTAEESMAGKGGRSTRPTGQPGADETSAPTRRRGVR